MLRRGNYFSGQKQDEKILRFVRRHWLSIFPWLFVTGILLILQVILIIMFWDNIIEIVTSNSYNFRLTVLFISSYLLFIFAFLLTIWMNYYLDITIITAKHLVNIKHMGLLNRQVAEQSLLRVQDVSSRMHGFFQTLFRYGTVYVETAGEAPNFQMKNIPRPYRIADTIMKQHEKYRHKELEKYKIEEENVIVGSRKDSIKYNTGKEKIIDDKNDKEELKLTPRVETKSFTENKVKKNRESFIELALADNKKDKDLEIKEEGELREGVEIKL